MSLRGQRWRRVWLIALVVVILVSLWSYQVYWRRTRRDPLIDQVKETVMILSPQQISQIDFYESKNHAYTRDKQSIHLCLRKKNGEYYDFNMLIYAALHELAHAFYDGDSRHHPPEWERLFREFLAQAHRMGIYDPSLPIEEAYCQV